MGQRSASYPFLGYVNLKRSILHDLMQDGGEERYAFAGMHLSYGILKNLEILP
jgi:hypothetical protein